MNGIECIWCVRGLHHLCVWGTVVVDGYDLKCCCVESIPAWALGDLVDSVNNPADDETA